MDVVHFAVTRQVKPGFEQAFEDALREFARESLREPGTTGIHLIAPVPGTDGCEYGILRSFESETASRRFYESDRFKNWEAALRAGCAGLDRGFACSVRRSRT